MSVEWELGPFAHRAVIPHEGGRWMRHMELILLE